MDNRPNMDGMQSQRPMDNGAPRAGAPGAGGWTTPNRPVGTPTGVRPAGAQGVRPAGAPGTRPAVSPAQLGKQAQPTQGQMPSGTQTSLNTGVSQPRPSAQAIQKPVNNAQPTARPASQARPAGQPNGQPVGQRPQSSNSEQEHVVKSSTHQRVIDSKPIKFDKDPNKKDYVLYMIIDKPIDGMLQYFRSYGLNVSKIFSRIEDARNALMMQVNPARIVIVDTGNGAFNSMSARKQVIDIIGVGDEENKVTVFYSDMNLKYEIEASKEIQKKALTWHKYKTTTHTLACLLQSRDCNYISDSGYRDASPIVANIDETLWKNDTFKDAEEHGLLPMINSSDVTKLVHDQTVEQLPRFTPILR